MFHGKKAFTLIEAIYSIVILALVLTIGFSIIEKLYVRNYMAKEFSKMEFLSQTVLDQISGIIYNRIPFSVIGYNQKTGDFKYIGYIGNNDNYPILEWIGYVNEAMVDRNMSGFIDLYGSKKPVLKALDFHKDFVDTVVNNKFNGGSLLDSCAVIFAGSFDKGEEAALSDYKDSYGWHNHKAKYVYIIDDAKQVGDDCNLSIKNADGSDVGHIKIYEKMYLADTAYAIAKKADLSESKWNCKDLKWNDIRDNDLLLFYNYRPWKKETFCGDGGVGNVTLLVSNTKAFRVRKINYHLELRLELSKKRGDINISVSKQKVTF